MCTGRRFSGRTPLAVADLDKAIAYSRQTAKRSYHARAYVALGDAYWRLSDLKKARQIWQEALQLFPGNELLQVRLQQEDKALNTLLTANFEQGKRVDTNVSGIWEEDETAGVTKLRFEEIGAQAGVRFVHSTRQFTGQHRPRVPGCSPTGSGGGGGDYNNDGLDDLFVTDSDTGNASDAQQRGSAFTDVAQMAEWLAETMRSRCSDALWFDYNNDGWLDLLVVRFGTDSLPQRRTRPGRQL
jgi:tetratricopeptide (TPR) repeat protein